MCRVWEAWVHMIHLRKISCHILAQGDPKLEQLFLSGESGVREVLSESCHFDMQCAVGLRLQCIPMWRSSMLQRSRSSCAISNAWLPMTSVRRPWSCGRALWRWYTSPHHQAMCWKPLASHRCSRLAVPNQHVGDALSNVGGFRFRGWVFGRGVVRSFGQEPPQQMHGVITARVRERWTCSWPRLMHRHGGLETLSLHSGELRRSVILAVSGAQGASIPVTVPQTQRWSQDTVILAFRKLFPAGWLEAFKFPLIEDLINQPPFSSFPSWLSDRGFDWDHPLGPHNAGRQAMLVQRHAEGQQAGAHSHGAALPPLFPFGLPPDEHFQQALHRAQLPLPFEHSPVLDQDLQFAAYLHAKVRGHLRRWRQQAVGALRELKQRWQGVTTMLRSRQEPAIQQVTQERDLGLTALLILLTSWADTRYPFGLVRSGLRCFPESASLPSHSCWCAIRPASPQQKHPLPTSPGTGWWVPIETIHSRCRERFLHVSHVKGWTAADYSRSSSSSHPKMCNYPELGETKSHR